MNAHREQMNVVIVGHVDHGKSTVIGRLLADTGSLPQGKLEEVKARCERNAKPFEYAFLLDALKDEQTQGITIDTARCFFKSSKRDYIIIDAPGHIEFLKNMITGAARAEAALLVIDAHEGIKENSKRHGYMMSFLGVKNIAVCVNKMDLVNFSQETFNRIKNEFTEFLNEINVVPAHFIPISARDGENVALKSKKMAWYDGPCILEAVDGFKKASAKSELEFRFPVQDIYKFTEDGDDRRIFAGRVESGSIAVGEEVIFLPSKKRSKITSIETFNAPQPKGAFTGQSTGFCLETQIYIKPGELMCKPKERLPHLGSKIRANIFWMGAEPFVKGKTYKLKIANQHVPAVLAEVVHVLDASELSSISNKAQVDRHDVAECVVETLKPVAFDVVNQIAETGRFVIVDNYEIAGGGIILAPVFDESSMISEYIKRREFGWERSDITPEKRSEKYKHKSALIIITGQVDTGKQKIAKALEEELFRLGKFTYFLGISNSLLSAGVVGQDKTVSKLTYIQELGELAHALTDAGLILITSISDIDDHELNMLKALNRPNNTLIVNVGENRFQEGSVDLALPENAEVKSATGKIIELLNRAILLDPEYFL